jgi:uncharacterized protein GlcG (DUF336 family)
MKKIFASLCFVLSIAPALMAQTPTPTPTPASTDTSTNSLRPLTYAIALQAAQATLENCRSKGFNVAVSVVDTAGQNVVFLRSELAPPHTIEGSHMKAYTIVCMGALTGNDGTSTLATSLLSSVGSQQVAFIPGFLLIQGGYVIKSHGKVIGAIGVAGSKQSQPGQLGNDEQCAQAGAEAVASKLN